jgi:hypothetical protein
MKFFSLIILSFLMVNTTKADVLIRAMDLGSRYENDRELMKSLTLNRPNGDQISWYDYNEECAQNRQNSSIGFDVVDDSLSLEAPLISNQSNVANKGAGFSNAIDAHVEKVLTSDVTSEKKNFKLEMLRKKIRSSLQVAIVHFPLGCASQEWKQANHSSSDLFEQLNTGLNVIAEKQDPSTSDRNTTGGFYVGLLGGVNYLTPHIRTRETGLYNVYEFVKISNQSLTWEEFQEIHQIKESFATPAYGVAVQFNFAQFILVEGMLKASHSEFKSVFIGANALVGNRIFPSKDHNWYFPLFGGVGLSFDEGWGRSTVVKLVRSKESRELLDTFYNPKEELGSKFAKYWVLWGGVGYQIPGQTNLNFEFNFRANWHMKEAFKQGPGRNTYYGAEVRVLWRATWGKKNKKPRPTN